MDHLAIMDRVAALETERLQCEAQRARIERELSIIRGPVPLEHKKPVDDGALGKVVTTLDDVRSFVKKVAIAMLLAVVGGAGGTWLAIRAHYVDQGREMERAAAKDRAMEDVERRVRHLEGVRGVYVAPDARAVVSPDP